MKTSATALTQYERCPHQYQQERIEKKHGQPPDGFRLGRVCHRVIQRLMQKHRQDGKVAPFDCSLASEFYQEEWAAESGLSGEDLFTEGLTMIIRFAEQWSQTPFDPSRILGIEEPFEITISLDDENQEFPDPEDDCAEDQKECAPYTDPNDESPHIWECPEHGLQSTPHCPECHASRSQEKTITLRGFIDLILMNEMIDASTGEVTRTLEIIDYKSSRAFLTTRDADSSIQLAIYDMAARRKWPNFEKYTCTLHMLRDGNSITISHEPSQLRGFKKYILATAQQIEQDTSWAPKLGPDCVWCHLRTECTAYQKALAAHNHIATESLTDLEQLAREREEVAIRAKIFNKRLDEIDAVLKEHLAHNPGPLFMGGYIFSMSKVESLVHNPRMVVDLLSERLELPVDTIIEATMEVQKKRLEQLLTEQAEKHGLSVVGMVKAALANRAERKITSRMNPPKKEKETHKKKKRD